MKKVIRSHIFFIVFIVFICFLYIHNLTRDIYSGDTGDLVSASCVRGVAHPPGYPLFTVVGSVFCHLPVPLPPVARVGLVSVFSSVLALGLLYHFAYRVTRSSYLSLLSVSVLAFSYYFWLHGEIPEVFGLNNLFVVAILYAGLRFHIEKKIRFFYLLAFFSGLSLTHHHTIMLLFPTIFILLIANISLLFSKKRFLLLAIVLFVLGLLPYLYVPLAASSSPIINWDDARTPVNFLRLLRRLDYGGFAPSVDNGVPGEVKNILLKDFIKTLVSTYSYQIIFVAVVGLIKLLRSDKWIALAILSGFLLAGPGFAWYSATYITSSTAWGVNERFYILASVVFVFLLPYGFMYLFEISNKFFSKRFYSSLLISYFLIIPFFLFTANMPKTDLSKTSIGNTIALDFLTILPKDALLFITGDTTTFNSWYVHYVLGVRRDIGLVNPPGVGNNMVMEHLVNAFHLRFPDTNAQEIVQKTLTDIQPKRRIFTTYDVPMQLPNFTLVPYGLIYEMVSINALPTKDEYIAQVEDYVKKTHPKRRESLTLAEQNLVTAEIPMIYANGFIRVGDFIASYYQDPALAEHYYRRALWLDNENPAAYAGLGLSLYKAYGDCEMSIHNMHEAIRIYPIWKKYYLQLFLLAQKCNNVNLQNSTKSVYRSTFKEDIQQVLIREKMQ